MAPETIIKLVYCIVGTIFSMVTAYGCIDPPNLYQSFPNVIHRYYSKPDPAVVETVGGYPVTDQKNIFNSLFLRSYRRALNKRHDDCAPNSINWRHASVEDRALCRWHYVPKHNASRYPNIVVEAESTCRECSSFYDSGLAVSTGTCEPVYRSFPVLERIDCRSGIYRYEKSNIDIKVAFVCARPRTALGENIINNNIEINYDDRR